MSIVDLLESLPNGLHDAKLHSIDIDYVGRTANLDLDVWIGDMSQQGPAREAYRHGRLTVSGLVYLVMEPPDSRYAFNQSKPLRIEFGIGKLAPEACRCTLPTELPDAAFAFWLYVTNWNSFIHVACTQVTLELS